MRRPTGRRLAFVLFCCGVFVLLSSATLATYVMPRVDNDQMPLAERIRSPKFGDSYGYGKYAEGMLQHRALRDIDGTPILKHMPGFSLLVALTFKTFGSVRPLLVVQVLFLFVSLYFFLLRVRDGFPAAAVMATPILIALHPSTIKHSSGVMTDLFFGSMLLWAAFLLWKKQPSTRDFCAVGAVFGLAVYVRESALPLMLMTALAYLLKDRRTYLRRVALMVCVCMAMLSPWAIRNQRLMNDFIPLTTKSSDLFYYSSIPLTREVYDPLGAGLQESGYDYEKLYEIYDQEVQRWAGGASEPGQIVSRGRSEPVGPREPKALKEVYNSWADRPLPDSPIREGLWNYYSRPTEQLSSLLLKTAAFFNKPAVLADLAGTSLSALLVVGNIVFYAFHISIILLGVALSFRAKDNPFVFLPYWIVAMYIQALLLWSEERYLMPFYPFLVLIALSWYSRRWHAERNSPLLAS
jgi:hypothetical protein